MTGFSSLEQALTHATGVTDPLGWIILIFGLPVVLGVLALRDVASARPPRHEPLVWHRGVSWEGVVPQAAPPTGDFVICLSCGRMSGREPGVILPEGWAWTSWSIGSARTFRYACSTPCTRVP